jgi:hypothetical protein
MLEEEEGTKDHIVRTKHSNGNSQHPRHAKNVVQVYNS